MPQSSSARMAVVLMLGLLATSTANLLPQLTSGGQPPAADKPAAGQVQGAGTTLVQAAPAITFLDTASTALVVSESTLSAALLVSNTSTATGNVELQLLLRSSRWRPLKDASQKQSLAVPPGVSVVQFSTPIKAGRSEYPLTGVFVMQELPEATKPRPKPSTMAVSSIALEETGSADWKIVKSAAICATLGVVLAAGALFAGIGARAVTTRMGASGSSLADGWSAALIIGGPFLTTAFNLGGFPDYPATMTKKMYLVVSFVLSLIIGVAPSIYGLYRAQTRVVGPLGQPVIQNQGISWLFVVSAWFTLTGCLAQLALLQLVFRDLTAASLLSARTGEAIDVVLWALWLAVAVYGPVAIYNTVKSQHDLQVPADIPAPVQPQQPVPLGTPAPPPAPPPAPAPRPILPDWSVL